MKSETLITKTPVCRFQYTWLVEPDTKYDPLWKVTCLIDPNDALELEKELDGYLENWKKQLKTANPDKKYKLANKPWSYTTVDDGDGSKNYFVVKTKMPTGGINRITGEQWHMTPPVLFNSENKIMTEEEKQKVNKCGIGTLGQVNLRVMGYDGNFGVGVKIQPQAVKIHKHVEYVKSAQDYGFDDTAQETTATKVNAFEEEF